VIGATEDFFFGGDIATGANPGDDSYIIVAGGATSSSWEAYGLNSWVYQAEFIDYNGLTGSAAAMTNKNTSPAYTNPMMNTTAELIMFTPADDAKGLLNAPTASNHCWTAIHYNPVATTTRRAAIAGFTASITTCL